jgi:hypothetical protein
MQESATASECVDFVLSPENIAQEIVTMRTQRQGRSEERPPLKFLVTTVSALEIGTGVLVVTPSGGNR